MSDIRTFEGAIARWLAKVESRKTMLFVNVYNGLRDSIMVGSPLTGAPGQPVDTATLKLSWLLGNRFTASEIDLVNLVGILGTRLSYAPVIEEDNPAFYDPRGENRELPHVRKSTVGGPHSVKLTHANWDKIVDAALATIIRETGG